MQSVVKYHNIKSTLKLMSQAFHQISVKIRKCEQEEWWVWCKRTNSNQKILWPGFVDCKLIWVKHENTWIAPIFDRVWWTRGNVLRMLATKSSHWSNSNITSLWLVSQWSQGSVLMSLNESLPLTKHTWTEQRSSLSILYKHKHIQSWFSCI